MESTVVKGLRVLEAMAMNPNLVTVTAVAAECNVTKSNAHRLLHTLEALGYVHRDPETRTYRPTLRQWEMGQRVYDRMNLPAIAARYLAQLAAETEETAHLSIFDNNEVLYLDKADGGHSVRTYVVAGEREPSHCTCSGKAMLAHLPPEVVEKVLDQARADDTAPERTESNLVEQLARIREQGYAMTVGEFRTGVQGFAKAITSPAGKLIGAIGIAGPSERMKQFDQARYVTALQNAVAGVERELGFI